MSVRTAVRGVRARAVYLLDGFLSYPLVVQALVLLGLTALLVGAWALVALACAPHDPFVPGVHEAVWWSLTHFFDGGTMASDPPRFHALALGATATGVLVLSLLTAAFASKMGERLGDVRQGLSPVIERGHLLALGFDEKVSLVAREIAHSGQRCTLVVLATEDKDRIEAALRACRRVRGSRLRTIVRTGDPRVDAALLRVSAARARGAIVVAPPALDDDASVRWTLSALLALRRAGEGGFDGLVLVEARHAEAREMLLLAAEPGVAGAAALATEVIASDHLVARVLAQSVRQEGVYFSLRQLLDFESEGLFLEPVPDALVGQGFDAAHAALDGCVLVGVCRADGSMRLCPHAGDEVTLARGDRLVVLASGRARFTTGGRLPTRAIDPTEALGTESESVAPRRVVLLGFNRTLTHLVREFDSILAPGSSLRVVCGSHGDEVARLLEGLSPPLARIRVECDAREPDDVARSGDDAVYGADAVVILGRHDERAESSDASALATLLWLRHGARARGAAPRRVVTEVRDPRSAAHVARFAHDFVVSTDVVAMLLAQIALEPAIGPVWREILSPDGTEVFVRPRGLYVAAGSEATFADVMAGARARGEVALGMYKHPKASAGSDAMIAATPTRLNPSRTTVVPDDACVQIVVLARPARIEPAEAAAERARADRAAAAMG